jgi:hypothetical protein
VGWTPEGEFSAGLRKAAAGAGHLRPEDGGLSSPEAQQTRLGEGHCSDRGADQGCFGGIAGLKFEHVRRNEPAVAAQGLALETDDAGIGFVKNCVS